MNYNKLLGVFYFLINVWKSKKFYIGQYKFDFIFNGLYFMYIVIENERDICKCEL